MSDWYFKSEHYRYPEPYETGGITKVRAVLNEADPTHCPQCNTNHNSWWNWDDKDLYCRFCGWRESEDDGRKPFIGTGKLIDDKALGFRPRRDYNGYTLVYGNGCHKSHNCFQCEEDECTYDGGLTKDRQVNTKVNIRLESLIYA